jgi:hypothetical protein
MMGRLRTVELRPTGSHSALRTTLGSEAEHRGTATGFRVLLRSKPNVTACIPIQIHPPFGIAIPPIPAIL